MFIIIIIIGLCLLGVTANWEMELGSCHRTQTETHGVAVLSYYTPDDVLSVFAKKARQLNFVL